MKITAITAQVKNPERVNIFVDGKYSFSLSLDEVIKEQVKKDLEINEVDLKRFKKVSDDGKLRARSLEWLLNRPHSIREFRDYLYRKKAEPELIESFIGEFTKRGYLDEQKFTAWFVELQKRRGKSDRAIRAELFKKGIGRELAEEVLGSEADETNRLKQVIAKKKHLNRYKNDPDKLKRYLTSQGFNWDDIKAALKDETEE
jgi:regulatory protein